MKKKLIGIVLLLVLFIPFKIGAYNAGISNYFIDAKVLNNGDLSVREIFTLEGDFNGFERIINYRNSSAPTFDGSTESFMGSDIYNGLDIVINDVKAITGTGSFDDLNKEGTPFNQTISADTGDYGVYTKESSTDGVSIRIYNPSSYNTHSFYIDYTIKNLGIVHQDIAEMGWNIFSNELSESIGNFELHINIPNNANLLKGWAHGPLYGDIKIVDNNNIKVTIKELDANTAMDVRFAFDKTVLSSSTKTTQYQALDKIIEGETAKADEANQEREEVKKQIEAERKARELRTKIMYVLIPLYLLGLIYIIYRNYRKYDKEYEATLKSDYYRDFPEDYGPEVVGYLIRRNVSNNDLSASILYLIYRKNIKYEVKDKKDYLLILNNRDGLNETEGKLVDWLFDDSTQISLSELKKKAKSSYSSFLTNYNNWLSSARSLGKSYQFFEDNNKGKVLLALYCIIGFLAFVFAINTDVDELLLFILICASFGSLIYIMASTKKTIKGNEDYTKWKALKKFMLDFGNMKEKDLPEIVLWEKYLVYAVTLGCATKLAKTMEVKMADMNNVYNNNMFDPYAFNNMMIMSNIVNSSVQSAVNDARAEQSRVNSSNYSSGGGFGGGFSGGGGSFGGGGGGGRF